MTKANDKNLYSHFAGLNPIVILILLVAIFTIINQIVTETYAFTNTSDQWQTVKMKVTAYCPCPKCCGIYSDGVTATGHKIYRGDTFVAADKTYSFGTEMLIPGYNNSQAVQVLDRGGAIKGNKLDVFFNTHKAALKWGVRYLDVKIRQAS
ncbi:MAG: hypothetical protein FVQ80_06215 [Planctomycetes bacterium]|nr:hypothetical protein [Planctomycetota bacterium]